MCRLVYTRDELSTLHVGKIMTVYLCVCVICGERETSRGGDRKRERERDCVRVCACVPGASSTLTRSQQMSWGCFCVVERVRLCVATHARYACMHEHTYLEKQF